MKKRLDKSEREDDMRPEYDFSKMKLIGRGIYSERLRSGIKVVLLGEGSGERDQAKLEQDASQVKRN